MINISKQLLFSQAPVDPEIGGDVQFQVVLLQLRLWKLVIGLTLILWTNLQYFFWTGFLYRNLMILNPVSEVKMTAKPPLELMSNLLRLLDYIYFRSKMCCQQIWKYLLMHFFTGSWCCPGCPGCHFWKWPGCPGCLIILYHNHKFQWCNDYIWNHFYLLRVNSAWPGWHRWGGLNSPPWRWGIAGCWRSREWKRRCKTPEGEKEEASLCVGAQRKVQRKNWLTLNNLLV